MFKHLIVFLTIATLTVVTGCHSISVEEDISSPVPEANPDPTGFNAGGGNAYESLPNNPGNIPGGSNWTTPEELNKPTAGADADGWIPVDPENRLGMPIIYFAYDSDVLVPSETANLDKIARYMSDKPEMGLVIEGHCDQRGTEEYNRALGERRANAIRAYLVKRGVADYKIKTVSYGEDKPAVSGNGESAWKQNRRGVPVPMILPR